MSKNSKLTPKLRFPEFRKAVEWEERPLGEIFDTMTGGTPERTVKEYWNGSIPWVTTSLVDFNTIYQADEFITEAGLENSSAKLFPKGTILMALYGQGKTRGKVALLGIVATTNQACAAILPRDDFNTAFTFLSLCGRYDELRGLSNSGGQENLSQGLVRGLPFRYPADPAEQQKVGACLSSLDELLAAAGRKLESLRAYKKGLMQQLFPRDGESVPQRRFPEFRNSGEWENKTLDDLAKRRTGHTPNKAHSAYYNGGIKWVSLADSKRLDKGLISQTEIEISQEGIENSSAVLHPAGSVILSRDAGVGKSAVTATQMAVSQHFIVWICDSGNLSNWFLYFVLQKLKPMFEQIATGSTIKTIGMPFFNAMRIIVPSFAEQQRIAACLSSLDDVLAAQSRKVQGLKAHKKGLMQQLFPSAAEAAG